MKGVEGTIIILKVTLKLYDKMAWIGFLTLRTGNLTGCCECGNEYYDSYSICIFYFDCLRNCVSRRTQLPDPSPLLSRNMNLIMSLLPPGGKCRKHSVRFLTSVEG